MENQTIAKPLGLIKDLKIFVHGVPYIVTFNFINNNVIDYSYSMLLGCPWLRDAKVSYDWGTNIVTIQGTITVRTIHVMKKLGVQTKRPEVLICYDIQFRILDEDVMFAIKLDLFSIGTIVVPTHVEPVSKIIYIQDLNIAKLVPKQPIQLICVLVVTLAIPPNIIKQHLLETFFHLEIGEMIIDETCLGASTRSNHSWLDSHKGGVVYQSQLGHQGECAIDESEHCT
jgi:hypothetical protein